jgi:hypothetical protein
MVYAPAQNRNRRPKQLQSAGPDRDRAIRLIARALQMALGLIIAVR